MVYTVTFYALRPGLGEIVVSVHRVERFALPVYLMTPDIVLGAARTVKIKPVADGFRVADPHGAILLDHCDRRDASHSSAEAEP